MKKIVFFIFIAGILSTSASAACCTCALHYATLAAKTSAFGGAVKSMVNTTSKEVAMTEALKEKEANSLAREKTVSEIIGRMRQADSAGFAFIIARLKAEGVIADAQRMKMMTDGYDQSNKEAIEIITEAGKK